MSKQNISFISNCSIPGCGKQPTFGGSGNRMMFGMCEEELRRAAGGPVASAALAAEVPTVDPSQPSATLQILLHDGRRVKAQLNNYHTVQHIKAIIAREGAGGAPYTLTAGFPPAALSDSQTLEEAGLKGAATCITQKLA